MRFEKDDGDFHFKASHSGTVGRLLAASSFGLILLLLPARVCPQSIGAIHAAGGDVPDCASCASDHVVEDDAAGFGSAASFGVATSSADFSWPGAAARVSLRDVDPPRESGDSANLAGEPSFDPSLDAPRQTFQPPGYADPWPQQAPQPPQDQNNKRSSPSAESGSPGHIFWVIPAFKVDYGQNFQPLTPREKFQEWARASYDPLGLGAGAVEAATIEHSSTDGFCGYGKGWSGYGKCFASLEADANISSFIGDYALTVLLHQDPRYFRMGEGFFGKRVLYAISRVFVTFNDSGHTVVYTSALAGTAIAAGISNLYYPPQDVSLAHTMSRIGIDLGNTALYNLAAEFWPDINNGIHRVF